LMRRLAKAAHSLIHVRQHALELGVGKRVEDGHELSAITSEQAANASCGVSFRTRSKRRTTGQSEGGSRAKRRGTARTSPRAWRQWLGLPPCDTIGPTSLSAARPELV
jgi:hypothetical protein